MNSTGSLPQIDSQQVQQQAPTAHITKTESMDRSEYVKALLVKLRAKLKTPIHDLAKAKVAPVPHRRLVPLPRLLSNCPPALSAAIPSLDRAEVFHRIAFSA